MVLCSGCGDEVISGFFCATCGDRLDHKDSMKNEHFSSGTSSLLEMPPIHSNIQLQEPLGITDPSILDSFNHFSKNIQTYFLSRYTVERKLMNKAYLLMLIPGSYYLYLQEDSGKGVFLFLLVLASLIYPFTIIGIVWIIIDLARMKTLVVKSNNRIGKRILNEIRMLSDH